MYGAHSCGQPRGRQGLANSPEFFVRFWGVRGSIACPGVDYVKYGGNTSCLEVRCGGELLIFDAGTGLRGLGESIKANGALDADLFLSHSHFDHVCGMPFFRPAYLKGNSFRFWAGHLQPLHSLEDVCCGLMMAPLFPVPMDIMGADIQFRDFTCGIVLEPREGVRILTAPLNHPNGAVGYRIEFAGKSICYVTDTEHPDSGHDQNIIELIRGADLFIYDSSYTDDEYPAHKGWGHSTWQEGVRLSDEAGVKTFVIFHHDPGHGDAFMDEVARGAQAARPGTIVAREGMVLTP